MNRREFLALDIPSAPPADDGDILRPGAEYYRSSRGLDRYIPSPDQPWDYVRAAHLLRRAMIGPTDGEIRRAVDEGLDATIERLLRPHAPSLELIDEWVGNDPAISSAEPEGPVSVVWVEQKLARRDDGGSALTLRAPPAINRPCMPGPTSPHAALAQGSSIFR